MIPGHQALLKEVYEKRKPVDQNSGDGKKLPPWLQKAKGRVDNGNEKAVARQAAIQKRLAKVPQQKGK